MPLEPETPNETEAAAVYQIARDASALKAPQFRELDDCPLVVWPESKAIESLEKFSAHPRRRRGTAALEDPSSFCAYVNRFKTAHTIVTGTASETGGEFHAILDFHKATEITGGAGGDDAGKISAAGWSEHRATYKLVPSPEWARWIAANKATFTQEQFAFFLENNADDIFVPSDRGPGWPNSIQMMEVALTLQAIKQVSFASGIRLGNGQHQLTYNEQIESKAGESGNTIIPSKFALSIAPFVGSPAYLVTARLRYRLGQGKVTFEYEIDRPHKVIQHAFLELRKTICDGTALPVLAGTIKP